MIWLDRLGKWHDREEKILTGVDLLILTGVTVGLVGEKGCGKSTLIKLLAGTELPSEGRLHLEGRVLWAGNVNVALHGEMTLLQGLRFLGRLYTDDDRTMRELVEEILDLAQAQKYRDTLWSRVPGTCKPLLKYAALNVVPAENLLIDAPLQKHQEALKKKMEEKIMQSATIIASLSEKILKATCDAGIVIRQKSLHYFDAIGEAIKFCKSEIER